MREGVKKKQTVKRYLGGDPKSKHTKTSTQLSAAKRSEEVNLRGMFGSTAAENFPEDSARRGRGDENQERKPVPAWHLVGASPLPPPPGGGVLTQHGPDSLFNTDQKLITY